LQQSYTPDGFLASLTDAKGNTTNFSYDGFDRLATTTYARSSTEVFGYDADGNLMVV
jgi:YD repeat-containing protein